MWKKSKSLHPSVHIHYKGKWEGVGPRNLGRFLGPVKWHRADRLHPKHYAQGCIKQRCIGGFMHKSPWEKCQGPYWGAGAYRNSPCRIPIRHFFSQSRRLLTKIFKSAETVNEKFRCLWIRGQGAIKLGYYAHYLTSPPFHKTRDTPNRVNRELPKILRHK